MKTAILVIILLLPNGNTIKLVYPQPNMSVCELEAEKAYREHLPDHSAAIIYCKKKT